jgi:hypothetical protein
VAIFLVAACGMGGVNAEIGGSITLMLFMDRLVEISVTKWSY